MKNLARKVSQLLGSPIAFGGAIALVIGWAVCGWHFHFSDSWSLFINTVTTVVTFLAVFLLQNAQNEDTEELHRKLDLLIASIRANQPPDDKQ